MSILEPFLIYRTVILTKGAKVSLRVTRVIGLIIVALIAGCVDDTKGKDILSHDEMVSLMVDMYLAEARMSTTGIPRDSAAKLFQPYENSIMAKRGLTDSILYVNYSYYLQKPEELEQILEAVIDTLNLRDQRKAQP